MTHLIHVANVWYICQHFIDKVVRQQNLRQHQRIFLNRMFAMLGGMVEVGTG